MYCNNKTKFSKLTVIHYVGNKTKIPEQNSVHRNSIKNTRPHVMTAKSQLQKQKECLGKKPKQVYRKLVSENLNHPSLTPVLTLKNPKQVSNTIGIELKRKLPSHDNIVGLYTLHLELQGFVKKLELVPNFVLVLSSEKMIQYCGDIAGNNSTTFYYDTTFDLGDFYVSTLVFNNTTFENEPCLPVAYVVHDSVTCHKASHVLLRIV